MYSKNPQIISYIIENVNGQRTKTADVIRHETCLKWLGNMDIHSSTETMIEEKKAKCTKDEKVLGSEESKK